MKLTEDDVLERCKPFVEKVVKGIADADSTWKLRFAVCDGGSRALLMKNFRAQTDAAFYAYADLCNELQEIIAELLEQLKGGDHVETFEVDIHE